jgi:hypothetical protein
VLTVPVGWMGERTEGRMQLGRVSGLLKAEEGT